MITIEVFIHRSGSSARHTGGRGRRDHGGAGDSAVATGAGPTRPTRTRAAAARAARPVCARGRARVRARVVRACVQRRHCLAQRVRSLTSIKLVC